MIGLGYYYHGNGNEEQVQDIDVDAASAPNANSAMVPPCVSCFSKMAIDASKSERVIYDGSVTDKA